MSHVIVIYIYILCIYIYRLHYYIIDEYIDIYCLYTYLYISVHIVLNTTYSFFKVCFQLSASDPLKVVLRSWTNLKCLGQCYERETEKLPPLPFIHSHVRHNANATCRPGRPSYTLLNPPRLILAAHQGIVDELLDTFRCPVAQS